MKPRVVARLALKLLDRVMELFCTLFGCAIGAIIALMCADIVLRDLRLGSLPWLIELTEYLIYAGTFLAAPWVLRQGSHVRVDMLLAALPRRLAIRLAQLVDALGLGISLVMMAYGAGAVAHAYSANMLQFKTWTAPEWLLLTPIPIGCGLLAIEFGLRMLRVPGFVSDDYSLADRPGM